MRIASVLIAVLLALPSMADQRDYSVLWSQGFDTTTAQAYSSSYRTSNNYWMFCADDFVVDSGDSVTMVEWWGQDNSDGDVGEFIIRFSLNDTTGAFDSPGSDIYERSLFDFTAEYLEPYMEYHYTAILPAAFVPLAGEVYWISIIAVHATQQWYWFECVDADYWGAEATMKSEFWGEPDWVPLSVHYGGTNYTEMAFVLYTTGDTPVRDKTWGQIKAMFR